MKLLLDSHTVIWSMDNPAKLNRPAVEAIDCWSLTVCGCVNFRQRFGKRKVASLTSVVCAPPPDSVRDRPPLSNVRSTSLTRFARPLR